MFWTFCDQNYTFTLRSCLYKHLIVTLQLLGTLSHVLEHLHPLGDPFLVDIYKFILTLLRFVVLGFLGQVQLLLLFQDAYTLSLVSTHCPYLLGPFA